MPRIASIVRPLIAGLLLAPVLVACSGDDGATSAADAATKVRETAQRAAAAETIKQVCAQVDSAGALADAKLTDAERTSVATLASVAAQAGVPDQYTAPLRTASDPAAKAGAVKSAAADLMSTCGAYR